MGFIIVMCIKPLIDGAHLGPDACDEVSLPFVIYVAFDALALYVVGNGKKISQILKITEFMRQLIHKSPN